MKRTIFFAALFCCGLLTANAQDATTATTSDFKAVAKSITAEVGFAPFGGTPLSIPYLKGRYFISDNLAVRLGLDIKYQHNAPTKDLTQNMFQMSIVPGIEKHFAGTGRLSPYIGGEVNVGFTSSSTDATVGGTTNTIKGAWTDSTGAGVANRGNFHLGVNLLAGTDYYFAKHFFAGLEMGYGFMMTSTSDITVNGTVTSKGGSNFGLGSNVLGTIRLGFVF